MMPTTTPLPPPLPQKPQQNPPSPPLCSLLPTLLSLLVIFLLRPQLHPFSPTPSSPIFLARDPPSVYASSRNYQSYPFSHVCSPEARQHFRTRFQRPHRPLGAARRTKTVEESGNRVLLSAIPHEVGDGLGHRTCILNFELELSFTLGLTYAHRVSGYGSLTRKDPKAVENFFGWGRGELMRETVLKEGCAEVGYENDTCEIPAETVLCRRVKTRAKGGRFNQIVIVPDALTECYLQQGADATRVEELCYPLVKAFAAAYGEHNTLFQIRPKLCYHEYLYTNFSRSAAWFSDKYWGGGERRKEKGVVKFEKGRVQVALHVRRGDFFNYTNRVLIPDGSYVDIVGRVKVALDEMMGANVPVTVHVYSEGVVGKNQRLKDNHDIVSMHKVYVNEHGEQKPNNHWEKIIREGKRFKSGYGVGRGWRRPDVKVKMHIASDTITSLHEMIAADFFIGSISGLSMQVVRNIGRGLVLLPVHESDILDDEFLVPFDYARNNVPSFLNESLLYEKVAFYARKNRLACSVW